MSETNRRITRELSLAFEATENSSEPLRALFTKAASGSQALAVVCHLRRRRSVAKATSSPETASKAVATTSSSFCFLIIFEERKRGRVIRGGEREGERSGGEIFLFLFFSCALAADDMNVPRWAVSRGWRAGASERA